MVVELTGIPKGWIDTYYVPYTGANSDVDLGSHNLTTTGDVTCTDVVLGSNSERLVYPTFSISGTSGDNPRTVSIQFKDYGGTNVAKYINFVFWQSTTAAYSKTFSSAAVTDGGAGELGTATTIERFAITNSAGLSQISFNLATGVTLYIMVVNPTDGKVYYTSGVWGGIPP